MNYELAKQLKDAGFPMKLALPSSEFIWGGTDTNGTVYQYPTLSELIEECGKAKKHRGHTYTFNLSYMLDEHWFARYERFDFASFIGPDGEGQTPEDAVAKLWLGINKK
jgi:hypothetical protein